jgi:hypothetical protein
MQQRSQVVEPLRVLHLEFILGLSFGRRLRRKLNHGLLQVNS